MKILDLHCDTLLNNPPLAGNSCHVDLDRLPAKAQYCQCFALFIHDDYRGQAAIDRVEELYRHYVVRTTEFADRICPCRTTPEIDAALGDGKHVALLTIEGGAALGGRMEELDRLAARGLKMMTLTWNGPNEIGGGAFSSPFMGLTCFGRDLVRHMEELKVAVDVSHLNDKTFWQVAQVARRPFLATHSNARAICGHPRNLSDHQIREVAGRGGIIGLTYYPQFLDDRGQVRGWDKLLRHMDYILEKGGEDCLALGSDFDGCSLPEFCDGVASLGQLYLQTAEHFGRILANRIFFANARAFLENFD